MGRHVSVCLCPIKRAPGLYGLKDKFTAFHFVLKETRFSLYACGGLPSLLPINSPDIIAHIKGLSYLSDYRVIRASLGGAF